MTILLQIWKKGNLVSSGNVFKDLGLPNPRKALAKAELGRQIHEAIKARRLTQKQAAEIMGIDRKCSLTGKAP